MGRNHVPQSPSPETPWTRATEDRIKAALAAAEAASDRRALAPLLLLKAWYVREDASAAARTATRLRALPEIGAAAPALRVYFAAINLGSPQPMARSVERLRAVLAQPDVAADPVASSIARIAIADRDMAKVPAPETAALLQAVADDARLSPKDPLRVAALVRLANVRIRAGNVEAARAAYEKTGLDAQSCALVDASPMKQKGAISSLDYPDTARAWGFSGWTVNEYDIDAQGQAQGVRTVVGYPPFVFGDAINAGIRRFRYTQSYRPNGALGCSGQKTGAAFRYVD